MIRFLISAILLFIFCSQTQGQVEFYQDKYQEGYLKDGFKVKFWNYYNSDGDLELKFNHTYNKIIYLKPDTSMFTIYDQGQWIEKKLDVHPRLIGSTGDFYKLFSDNLEFPEEAIKKSTQGTVYATFEININGQATNFDIYNDIGDGCGNMVLNLVSSIQGIWTPAILEGRRYKSKFIIICF